MSGTSVTMHRIVAVETEAYEIETNTIVRKIILRDEKGEELEITLFASRDMDDLNIRDMDAIRAELSA